jgi:hypothetical protein
VKKIHEFHDKLPYSVQSLETLNQLEAVNGTVSMTLEKLPAIRGDFRYEMIPIGELELYSVY